MSSKRSADLADSKFRGRICTRSGKHVYNVALIASVIAHEGEEAAEKWLMGVRDNLARKPQGNDRAQAKGIYEGVCDVAISNHYYMGKMATNEKKPEQKEWAKAVNVQFLDQNGRGNHVNISGAAVIKGAKNRDNAVALLEFLAGDRRRTCTPPSISSSRSRLESSRTSSSSPGARSSRTLCLWKTSRAIEPPRPSSWTRSGSMPDRGVELSSSYRLRGEVFRASPPRNPQGLSMD